MKAFIARVRFPQKGDIASHIVDVEDEARGRIRFHFKRICHSVSADISAPIPHMQPASFAQQLRSMNRAYSVTTATEDEFPAFIELMLKDAYGDDSTVEIEEIKN